MSKTYIIRDERIRANAINLIRDLPTSPLYQVVISEVKSIRTLEQNAKMWAMLTDVSRQVEWYGMYLRPEEWKDMATAALKGQKTVPGLEGGFVVIGASTSKMSIKEMIDVIDFLYAFGSDPNHPVKWAEKAEGKE